MGPVRQAPASKQYAFATTSAFPSPASTTGYLDSPTLQSSLAANRNYSQLLTPRDDIAGMGSILPSEPDIAKIAPVMTPLAMDTPEPIMDLIVGGALAPVHSAAPIHTLPVRRSELRLPSFEALGIAAPHPDRIGAAGLDGSLVGSVMEPLSVTSTCIDTPQMVGDLTAGIHHPRSLSDIDPLKGGRAIQSPVHQYVNVLTPPADGDEVQWRTMATMRSTGIDSPSTDPGISAPQDPSAPVEYLDITPRASASQPTQSTAPIDGQASFWSDGAIDILLSNLLSRDPSLSFNSVKVLSHALPSPSTTGHVFNRVIQAIHGASTPTSPISASSMTWINVFHAIPGRFNLADIPTSPPNTPGPSVGGDDYFTQKVFDTAVSITDYQTEDTKSLLPRSPLPVVPPSSIDVSVVERYIPPSTANEFSTMFDVNGPSILVDRLIELSPHNGTLLFIYPTKAGAQTFMKDYLGPILDPLLRTLVVVHGLSSDLSRTLGSMASADLLLDHETMQRRVSSLCSRLTQRSSYFERFQRNRPTFALAYASKQDVKLDRDAWARDWWTKQEKPRIRDAVTKYSQEAQKRSSNEYVERSATPTELLQQLVEGVIRKPYQSGHEPDVGIEVSVFVIKRSG